MNITQFTENLAIELGEASLRALPPSTILRDLEIWDSMAALSVMAMVSTEYHVELTADELARCKTIGDLAETVKNKLG